jgi:6-phosphogluconolactonase
MKAPIVAVLLSLASSAHVLAGTFVYVANAEDGDIGMYTLQADGLLQPGQRFKATKLVMPMAVSPDKRLPRRRRALQAVPGVQLQHRQELRRA